jgi:UDP-glucose 4-epimerase
MGDPIGDFAANCWSVLKVLEAIRTANSACRYLHISSAAVYGNPTRLPVKESDPLGPLSPYGWHKQVSETLCREYFALYKLPVAMVRPFSIYGPGLSKQFFWDLYQKCKQSTEVTLWGTGRESRDFIYIADFVRAIDIVLSKSPMEADVYNIASGVETPMSEAAATFARHFNAGLQIGFNRQTRPGDPLNWKADISRIGLLGYVGEYSLERGLRETIRWLKDSG